MEHDLWVTLGDAGLGHGVGLGDQHGTGEHDMTFRVTLGDTGLGHGVGLGDQHGGLHETFVTLGTRRLGNTWVTRGWDMGWV